MRALALAVVVAAALVPSMARAQRILNADEAGSPPSEVIAEQETRKPGDRPLMLFVQPLQTALYATLTLADWSSPRIAVPIGVAIEANPSADYVIELTAVNIRGRGTLQKPPFGASNNGNFSRTSLLASVGYQMYSLNQRTGLFLTPKLYGALFQESQTAPEQNNVGGQIGAGIDLGASVQFDRFCIQLVGGLSMGITGGAAHDSIISPLIGLGGSTTESSLVVDLNANLLRLGFAF